MISDFNPDINNGNEIFGLTSTKEEALINIISVPWDMTASYGKGAADGPDEVFKASFQLDLFREFYPDFWKAGISMLSEPDVLKTLNGSFDNQVSEIVLAYNKGELNIPEIADKLQAVNDACHRMNTYVYENSLSIMNARKIPVVLGGDHSSGLGLITALSETNENFGILQIDAHADLRKAYQGFVFSHASIMYNALRLQSVSRLVQVGIRDYCSEEERRIRHSQERIVSFTDRYIQHEMFEGVTWQEITAEIINSLPAKVYVSFDIDGLNPLYCPDTGTPVPGGLFPEQISYLLEGVCNSGRKIIGADLCEVAPSKDIQNQWNGNVGARILLDLCMYLIHSNR